MSFDRLIIIVAIFCLLLGSSAQAVGIGVKPKKLDLNVTVGKEVETEILVINVSPEPAMYQIYSDSLTEIIDISPADFQLDAQANQLVKIKIRAKTSGLFATNISAVARSLGGSGLTAGSGIKIPITIDSSGISIWWIILGLLFVVCLIMIFIVILLYKKKGNTNS